MEEVEASEPDLGLRPPPEVLLQCQAQINAKCEYRCGLDARRTWSFEENEASFAAVAAVATAAQVQAIRSQQYQGGGGSVSAPSGGGSAVVPTPVDDTPIQAANDELIEAQAAPQIINVSIDGSIDPSGARRIVEALNDATEDGLQINALVGT